MATATLTRPTTTAPHVPGSPEDVAAGAKAMRDLTAAQREDGYAFECSYRGLVYFGRSNPRSTRDQRAFTYDRATCAFVPANPYA